MYKPNFCAECGSRVERPRWRPWTSRRFCPACEKRFRASRLALPLAACAVLLIAGFAAGRLARPSPPPLIVSRAPSAPTLAPLNLTPPATAAAQANASVAGGTSGNAAAAPRYGPDGTTDERPTDPGEVVSICGARTKKGTPCSRRVRGTGRCWQHKGRPSLIPPQKLIVTGN